MEEIVEIVSYLTYVKYNSISILLKKHPRIWYYEVTLYSCGKESLYTSIPIDLGLKAISYWLNNQSNSIIFFLKKNLILKPRGSILRNGYFKFDEKHNQTEVTAMGAKCAPWYTCLVIGYKEETKLFPISLPKLFLTEELNIKEVFK